jgi:DNA-binding response OmpR family regulator
MNRRRVKRENGEHTPMSILVIEDDPKTGDYLKKGLKESGYAVDLARTGTDGLHMALENTYDLVVLDVMLPGIDGWQIMQALRDKRDLPVLFLTARDRLDARIRGLELGADDYLVKPFSFIELVLRIRTLLRRGVVREGASRSAFDARPGLRYGCWNFRTTTRPPSAQALLDLQPWPGAR